MKKQFIIALILGLFLPLNTVVYALTPGDYNIKYWGGGLNIWISYPQDTSPGDTVKVNIYVLSGKYSRGNYVEEVKAVISVLTSSGSATLLNQVLIANTLMPPTSDYNHTFNLHLPSDARWFMTIKMDTVSYQYDKTDRQESHVILDSTKIRMNTYDDLVSQFTELKAAYDQLSQQYTLLKNQLASIQLPNDTSNDCSVLLSNYQQLLQDYDSLTTQYNQLLANQGDVPSPDTPNEIEELEQRYTELQQEFDSVRFELENSLMAKTNQINELSNVNEQLKSERGSLESELNEVNHEYDSYKETHNISADQYEELEANYDTTVLTRNVIILVAAVLGVGLIYLAKRIGVF
jgi:predicted  nucleic acid-binding Zn-ribbon protein